MVCWPRHTVKENAKQLGRSVRVPTVLGVPIITLRLARRVRFDTRLSLRRGNTKLELPENNVYTNSLVRCDRISPISDGDIGSVLNTCSTSFSHRLMQV